MITQNIEWTQFFDIDIYGRFYYFIANSHLEKMYFVKINIVKGFVLRAMLMRMLLPAIKFDAVNVKLVTIFHFQGNFKSMGKSRHD